MKKRLVLILAAVLMLGCAGGCGKKTEIVKDTEFMEAIANDTERGGNKKEDTEDTEEKDTEESGSRNVMYATDTLNVRTGAGTNYDVLKKLSVGDRVIVIGEADADGWVKVHSDADEGYCKLEYLSTENPSEETASADSSASGSTDSTGTSSSGSSTAKSSSGSSTSKSSSQSSDTSSSSDSYTSVSYSSDYSLLPDNEYDRIDIDYCERHNMVFSVSSSGKITWYHDEDSCTADADDPFDMNNIYK